MPAPKYKQPMMQNLYEGLLKAAADPSSELYYDGKQHRGAGHRVAFWDGFSGKFELTGRNRSANVVPGTLSAACFMAGREWARRCAREAKVVAKDPRGGPDRNQGRKPKDSDFGAMKTRGIRMTASEWEDARAVGMDEVRRLITLRASELRGERALVQLRASAVPMDAHQVAKALGMTAMDAGRTLAALEERGTAVSSDEQGTENDLYRRFSATK